MSRPLVKFCGLVRARDVREACLLGVDAIGFVFYPKSPRYISLARARRLRRLLPSWVRSVGLFVNADPAQVRHASAVVGLDVIQYHGDEDELQCARGLLAGQPYWRAVRMRERDDLLNSAARHTGAQAFLLDAWSSGFGGSGRHFDWSLVPGGTNLPLIVSGGLDARSVGDAIAALSPLGVDVSTGIQASDPRTKDAERMRAFMAAVRARNA